MQNVNNRLHLTLAGELVQNWIVPNIVGIGMHLETCSELGSEPVLVSEKINNVARPDLIEGGMMKEIKSDNAHALLPSKSFHEALEIHVH